MGKEKREKTIPHLEGKLMLTLIFFLVKTSNLFAKFHILGNVVTFLVAQQKRLPTAGMSETAQGGVQAGIVS